MTPRPVTATIRAAGAVLWRPAQDTAGGDAPPASGRRARAKEPAVEIAVVHRPRYDDWSLPKGKVDSGEHVLLAAVREVAEETGCDGVLGRPLGTQRYQVGGAPKTVRYWAMRATGGAFTPSGEVDEVHWLTPRRARERLTRDLDRKTLARLLAGPADTVANVLVRHASAGQRSRWPGPDRDRPLDARGRRQAAALVGLLDCYRPATVRSADVLRCLETIRPYAAAHELTVDSEPLLSETGYAEASEASVARYLEILATGEPNVACSQGKTMPHLMERLCRHFDRPVPRHRNVPKGSFWVLHLAGRRLVAVERHDARPVPAKAAA